VKNPREIDFQGVKNLPRGVGCYAG